MFIVYHNLIVLSVKRMLWITILVTNGHGGAFPRPAIQPIVVSFCNVHATVAPAMAKIFVPIGRMKKIMRLESQVVGHLTVIIVLPRIPNRWNLCHVKGAGWGGELREAA